jgi:hypothetical protein
MIKRKSAAAISTTPSHLPILVAFPGGPRISLDVTPEEAGGILKFLAAYNRFGAFTPTPANHTIDPERFKRGLLLLAWIRSPYCGKGELTKELVNEIKIGCKDWPEVRAYRRHGSREKLRNALRNLADDARSACRDGRLPRGWRK